MIDHEKSCAVNDQEFFVDINTWEAKKHLNSLNSTDEKIGLVEQTASLRGLQ